MLKSKESREGADMMLKNVKLEEEPKKKPIVVEKGGVKDSIRVGTATYIGYKFLVDNPTEAFSQGEMSRKLDVFIHSAILKELEKKEYIYRTSFQVPTLGKYGSYLCSYSRKAIWKRIWEMTPNPVKKFLMLLEENPSGVYSVTDIMGLTGATRDEVDDWLWRVYNVNFKKEFGFSLVNRKHIKGIRCLYYHRNVSEEEFQRKYDIYYKDNVLKEGALRRLKGEHFEEWASWTFCEYMRLKGYNIDLQRFDREPLDYIGRINLNVSELFVKKDEKEINLAKFFISCKSGLNHTVLPAYVLGFSGCLREGYTFSGEQIFAPRNSIGVILCVSASPGSWRVAARLGIRIFSIDRLMSMYETVKEKTGQEHPLFKRLILKLDKFREMVKRG